MFSLTLRIPQYSRLHPPNLTGFFWQISKTSQVPKTLFTFWKYVSYVWIQISFQGVTMGEGRGRGYNDFSLRMSSSLSKRWVCCVMENLFRVFFWIVFLTFVGNEGIYIVWVKGKKVTLKILKAESFAGTSRGGTSCETLAKLIA